MGIEEVKRIKDIFSELKVHATYLEHEAVLTSEDAARTRGFELRQGVKALVFTDGKDNWVIVDVPADRKVDQKKVASFLGWSKGGIRMATPTEVLEKTGCEIGAVPPFGHKEKIKVIVDKGVYENEESDFNIGLRTHSVKIPTHEMRTVFNFVAAEEGEFCK